MLTAALCSVFLSSTTVLEVVENPSALSASAMSVSLGDAACAAAACAAAASAVAAAALCSRALFAALAFAAASLHFLSTRNFATSFTLRRRLSNALPEEVDASMQS